MRTRKLFRSDSYMFEALTNKDIHIQYYIKKVGPSFESLVQG